MDNMNKRKIQYDDVKGQIDEILNTHTEKVNIKWDEWTEHAELYFEGNMYELIETAVDYWIDNDDIETIGAMIKETYRNTILIKNKLEIDEIG